MLKKKASSNVTFLWVQSIIFLFWYFLKCCPILFGFSFFVRGYFCCFWALRSGVVECFAHSHTAKLFWGLRRLGRSASSSEKTELDSGKFTPLYWEVFQVNYHEPLAGDEATYLASDQWVLAMSHPEHRLLWWAKLKISFHSKAEVWVQK